MRRGTDSYALANSIFAIVLACASAATLVIVGIAAIIALAYVF